MLMRVFLNIPVVSYPEMEDDETFLIHEKRESTLIVLRVLIRVYRRVSAEDRGSPRKYRSLL